MTRLKLVNKRIKKRRIGKGKPCALEGNGVGSGRRGRRRGRSEFDEVGRCLRESVEGFDPTINNALNTIIRKKKKEIRKKRKETRSKYEVLKYHFE